MALVEEVIALEKNGRTSRGTNSTGKKTVGTRGSLTRIEMFTDNPGGEVTSSVKYFQVLSAMIIAGVATSIKKTLLTLYLVSAKL